MTNPCNVPRWQQLKASLHNLEYDQFVERYNSDREAICIDVRTAEEYSMYHLERAINIDYLSQSLADHLEKLDPQKNYYIYCRTGRRSSRVSVILRNMGFEHVHHLRDGIMNKM